MNPLVCGFTRLEFYHRLKDMVDTLRHRVEQLRSKKRRIEAKLKLEESAYKKATLKVTEWLYKADNTGAEVDRLMVEAERELEERRTVLCYPWNRRSTATVGLSVLEKLEAVNQLLNLDNFDVVVQRTPHPHVDVIPVEPTVDFESTLEDVWRCLDDERLQIIGIFGMAGVGKTTLLKKIKKDMERRGNHTPAVIWLSAPKETRAIKKDMAKELTVFSKRQKKANECASDSTTKFILLIDDLWERLDLSNIVAPYLNGKSYKVVFTTRSEAVCDDMAAGAKLKLNCLSNEEALKLFWMSAGDGIRDSFPRAQDLAAHLNESICQGLPLALVAVGRAMAGTKNPSFEELSGMKHIFHVLEPSYDNLDDDMVKRLFLYCSILPGKIRKDELIRLWIGERFVNVSDKRRGYYFVKRLEQACLLESDQFNDSVTMHSVIRAFGLYLCRKTKKNILVQKWRMENFSEAVRISIDGEIGVAPLPWQCPRLRTLFITNSSLAAFPGAFFESMHSLEVLNLSNNGMLAELPSSIGMFAQLRYLNFSCTSIRELPVDLGDLKKLKVLVADYTEKWKTIPSGMIQKISSLEVFSKVVNKIYEDVEFLKQLESIKDLNEISVSLFSDTAVDKLLGSQNLQSCIRRLTLAEIKHPNIPASVLQKMVQLENLVIVNCTDLQFQIQDLTRYHVLSIQGLWIQNCSGIDNLRWLMFAPGLEVLDLRSCESLVEVIGRDFEPEEIAEIDERLGIFSNLKRIHLEDLHSLECICPKELRFPALKSASVRIINCPQLYILPFDENKVSKECGSGHLPLESKLTGELSTPKKDDVVTSSANWSTQVKTDVGTSSARLRHEENPNKGDTVTSSARLSQEKTPIKDDVVISRAIWSIEEKDGVVTSSARYLSQEESSTKDDVGTSSAYFSREESPTEDSAVTSSTRWSIEEKSDAVTSRARLSHGETPTKDNVSTSSAKWSTEQKGDVVTSSAWLSEEETPTKDDVVESSEKCPSEENDDVATSIAQLSQGESPTKDDVVTSSAKWSTEVSDRAGTEDRVGRFGQQPLATDDELQQENKPLKFTYHFNVE